VEVESGSCGYLLGEEPLMPLRQVAEEKMAEDLDFALEEELELERKYRPVEPDSAVVQLQVGQKVVEPSEAAAGDLLVGKHDLMLLLSFYYTTGVYTSLQDSKRYMKRSPLAHRTLRKS